MFRLANEVGAEIGPNTFCCLCIKRLAKHAESLGWRGYNQMLKPVARCARIDGIGDTGQKTGLPVCLEITRIGKSVPATMGILHTIGPIPDLGFAALNGLLHQGQGRRPVCLYKNSRAPTIGDNQPEYALAL